MASFPSLLASSEPLLDSDEESRRIKSWLREDDKIEFDFEKGEKGETGKKVRPKSGRMTAEDIDERRVEWMKKMGNGANAGCRMTLTFRRFLPLDPAMRNVWNRFRRCV